MACTCGSGSSPLARGLRGLRRGAAGLIGIIPARAGFTSEAVRTGVDGLDHPRSRGVYTSAAWAADLDAGSSPLARGLLDGRRRRRGHHGIIPARAGFTTKNAATWLNAGDHPRSRGVYTGQDGGVDRGGGSSPLARGLLQTPRTSHPAGGIIPARAGFTEQLVHDGQYRGDHPRSRGVYPPRRVSRIRRPGSSPLARGLQHGRTESGDWAGIIPARAGFTGWVAGRWAPPRDHPRSRGVYDDLVDVRTMTVGSSPLARGLPVDEVAGAGLAGIIPARAGFTTWSKIAQPARGDHPRSRGVYRGAGPVRRTGPGSSPLARGLRAVTPTEGARLRIIPARAGFTHQPVRGVGERRDHPRSRGVYANDEIDRWTKTGSSPLARGLPCDSPLFPLLRWIIPARAGFTKSSQLR